MLVFLAWWRVFNKSEILLPKVVYYDFLWALNPSWKSSPTELSINFRGPSWQPHGHQPVHPQHHHGDDWKKTIYPTFWPFQFVDVPSGETHGPPEQDGDGPQQVDLLPPDDRSWSFATWRLDCLQEGLSHNGDTSGPPLLNFNTSVDTLKTSSRYSKFVLFSNDSWAVMILIVL